MKGTINRKFIESIITDDNAEFSMNIQNLVLNLVSLAIDDLSQSVPYISTNNVVLQPANETFNAAFSPMSKYVYLLGISSPQMEMNCLNHSMTLKKLKNRLTLAWQETRRKKRRRKKKDLEENKPQKYTEFEPEKYNLFEFRKDFQQALAKNLTVTSIIYNTSDRLIIQGKDDFGSLAQIEIIPTIYDGEVFKYFLSKRKGFLNIDMGKRLINYDIKSELAGDNFFFMMKILNNLFKNLAKDNVNQIFVESLLYNVPNTLFDENDIYVCYNNIINFLNMTDISKFRSIDNDSQPLIKNKLIGNSFMLFNRFMKNVI